MDEIFKSLASLFSAPGILGFFFGITFEYVFLKLRCHYLDKTCPEEGHHTVKIKRVYWVWALVFIVIGGLTYKAQTTSDQVVQISKDTQECSRQFNGAFKQFVDITKEAGAINARWQDANFVRTAKLNELVMKFGSSADSRYLAAKMPIDQEFYETMNGLFKEREETSKKRAELGYPDPACGK